LVIFLIGPVYLVVVWLLGEDKRKTPQIHMFNRNWTTTSDFINSSTLNSELNWEETILSSEINKHAVLIAIMLIFHGRFANATQVSMCESN
jgi:hypothetical protein